MKFDSHIPIPPGLTSNDRYCLSQMKPGDSFFAPGKTSKTFTAASAFQVRNPGWRFTTRTVIEDGVKGIRCWCVQSPKLDALPVRKVFRMQAAK